MTKSTSPKSQDSMRVISDEFAVPDLIGYADHAAGLVEMISSVGVNKGSFTIGIFGEWGAGKTSLLRQIEGALKEKPTAKPGQRILTVWFNPWQFAGEPHLIIPFFHTLVAELNALLDPQNKTWDQSAKTQLRKFFERVKHVPAALAYGLEAEFKLPHLLNVTWSAEKSVKREEELAAKSRAQNEATKLADAAKEYVSLYYRLIEEMRAAVKTLHEAGTRIKIVVLVDDLDRCLPEKAVELLEGLKVLLDVPDFVFVLGVSRTVIERGVQVRYKELFLHDGRNEKDLADLDRHYLDKIVQFPFALPPADPQMLVDNILAENLKPLGLDDKRVRIVYEALGHNPRTLKRFINSVAYIFWVAKQKESTEKEYEIDLLLRACLLAYGFHDLYIYLCDQPNYLLRLQSFLREQSQKKPDDHDDQDEKTTEKEKGLAIPEIDPYLKNPHRIRLQTIFENWDKDDRGFETAEKVSQHLCLLAPTAGTESKAEELSLADYSESEYLDNLMVRIPAGTFTMGEGDDRVENVAVSSFLIGKYPVTQELYQKVMGENPSFFASKKNGNHPVEKVSWYEAVDFCNRLSRRMGRQPAYDDNDPKNVRLVANPHGYRLATEAEWEYACRAGTIGVRYADKLEVIAWYRDNSEGRTHPVGQKNPNDFGLYDMLGNVWEWVEDDWFDGHRNRLNDAFARMIDPRGRRRVRRGGGWSNLNRVCRSAVRGNYAPGEHYHNLGFRIARSLP